MHSDTDLADRQWQHRADENDINRYEPTPPFNPNDATVACVAGGMIVLLVVVLVGAGIYALIRWAVGA